MNNCFTIIDRGASYSILVPSDRLFERLIHLIVQDLLTPKIIGTEPISPIKVFLSPRGRIVFLRSGKRGGAEEGEKL